MDMTFQIVEAESVPDSGRWWPDDRMKGSTSPSLGYSLNIWNFTSEAVSVADRQGLAHLIPPTPRAATAITVSDKVSMPESGIYFRVDIRGQKWKGVDMDMQCALNRLDEDKAKNLKHIRLSGNASPFSAREEVASFTYFVSAARLKTLGEYLYIKEVDLLISTTLTPSMLEKRAFIHPWSEEGEKKFFNNRPDNLPTLKASGMFIAYVINTPKPDAQRFYANLGGVVCKVPIVLSTKVAEGVWFYTHETDLDELDELFHRSDLTARWHSLKQVENGETPIKLYHTEFDARTLGDPASEKSREIEAQRRELELKKVEADRNAAEAQIKLKELENKLKAEQLLRQEEVAKEEELRKQRIRALEEEAANQKLEYERQMTEMRLEMQRKEAEFAKEKAEWKAKMDEEERKRKSYYEERSYDRKDSESKWKLITGLIVGGLAIVGAIVKFLF